jgi:hypothetical protein
MPDAGKTDVPAIRTNAVIQQQVATVDVNLDAVAEEGHYAVTGNG